MRFLYCIFYVFVLAIPAFLCDSSHAFIAADKAQLKEYKGIVAIVNGDIITFRDLENRVLFSLFSVGGNVTPEMKEKISKEVLQEMINEILRWQCCKKFEPKGGWISEKEVLETFSDFAKQRNMDSASFAKFLELNGIDKNILFRQIRVNLCWVEYIRARFGKFINISDSEIKRTMQYVKEKADLESYHVFRMFFPVSNISDEGKVSNHVNSVMNILRQGADFENVARQFSQSPDANRGGDLGWIFKGQLSTEETNAIEKMHTGTYKIVRNSRGYVILFLYDKKEAGLKTFTDMKVAQIIIPFGENSNQEAIHHLMNYAIDMKKASANCHELMKKAKDSGFIGVSDPIKITLERAPVQYREYFKNTNSGGMTDPIPTPNGIVIFCILDKKTEKIKEPTLNELKSMKINERLSVFAERELQDLRKKAFLEIDKKYVRKEDTARYQF